ncbi:MAG: M16 family metallopeptidase, partial [Erysipelotrichaceae bacterium]
MQRIDYPDFKETCFYEEMKNGLKVYVFHKPDFKSSYAAFGTPYGALDIHQKYHGKHYDFHPGIAHFLEHKVFEDEDGDVLSKFAELGASVNAFTSYTETVYHFSLTGEENFREALEMLLDFVQKLNISHDSIEAEKPIIIQEVSMYEQQANTRLLNETYKSLFKNYPLINDIGG